MRFVEFLKSLVPRRDPGRLGERVAARHLRQRGLRILARNWRARSGEIDLIALDGSTIVFVEVKATTIEGHGDPLERINARKLVRIRRAARAFLAMARSWHGTARLDGVVVHFARGKLGATRTKSVRWYPGLHSLD